jgi:hypothetical protein
MLIWIVVTSTPAGTVTFPLIEAVSAATAAGKGLLMRMSVEIKPNTRVGNFRHVLGIMMMSFRLGVGEACHRTY